MLLMKYQYLIKKYLILLFTAVLVCLSFPCMGGVFITAEKHKYEWCQSPVHLIMPFKEIIVFFMMNCQPQRF